MKVLLVEDDPVQQVWIKRALKRSSEQNGYVYDVDMAPDGEQALEMLQAGLRPDFILLDLRMPRMDGLELLRIIKADDKLKMLTVVILTTSKLEINDAYKAGTSKYLIKPFDSDTLTELFFHYGKVHADENVKKPIWT